ncbi:hypothetical protein [Mycobacterium kansasii]|uniref:hypothetical protein n=1 Tax=Mycobacterium kansasii TaxID=1768 RepID=UPI0009EF74B9|nr:hypothetical protein [Mycobacterium kansasii]ARG91380.1 hypothetical protein B1T50_04500 [Mycobacterium kansasii]
MTLADRLHTIAAEVRNRILILDVERLDGITQQHWWDRDNLKNRYIVMLSVITWSMASNICALI